MILPLGPQACIIGKNGFLGGALANALGNVTTYPTDETKVIFDFGSYVHPRFEQNPNYQIKTVITRFIELLEFCERTGATFVYPSSALVYEGITQFSNFKLILEDLVKLYRCRTLGLRIFPVYGPRESRTVISQWCREMARGNRPKVYGNGKQTRDFIYISDFLQQTLTYLAHDRDTSELHRLRDVGTGIRTSFNDIIKMINTYLGTDLAPEYEPAPNNYSPGIVCATPPPSFVSVSQGIEQIIKSL
jgi:nucleoside-diphosphate-sugar epimerase